MFFLYGKVAVAFLAYLMDTRLFIWYMIMYGVLFFAVQSPTFDWGDAVEVLTPPTLRPYTTEGLKKPPLLVFFFAPWHTACVNFIPTFASISSRYASNNLRFGKVDVSRWPELAEKFDIDTDIGSLQLPSLLLFEDGHVSMQAPSKESVAAKLPVTIDYAGAIAFFQLDERLAGTYQHKKNSKKKN